MAEADQNGGHHERREDPLILLRDATMANKKVKYVEEYLEFDSRRVHRRAKCAYRLQLPKGPLLDIGSIWYMLHEISSGDRSYTPELTKRRGFTYIGVACRADLMDYLVGRQETCIGLAQEVIDGRKRAEPRTDSQEKPSKRRKAEGGTARDDETFSKDEITPADITARVRRVEDFGALVRCAGDPVPNVELMLKLASDELNHWGKPPKPVPSTGLEKKPLTHELEGYLAHDPEAHPIILVPCNKNAPINLLNAHDFLQHGVYKRPDEEHLRFFESTRPEAVKVSRNICGKLWTFEVRDNAAKFTKSQWKRCIAVISDGSDWQFKGWPFKTTVDLWVTMMGIFIETPQVYVPVHVNSWQVKILKLHAMHLGHRFAQVRDKFFEFLEQFMNSNRMPKFCNDTAGYDCTTRTKEKPKPIL